MLRTRVTRRHALSAASIAALLGTTLALTSCANPIQAALDNVTSSAADSFVSELTDGQVQGLGSAEIPADFPQSVPLPDAEVTVAIRHETEGRVTWMISYEGADKTIYDSVTAKFASSGFTEESNTDLGGAMRMASFSNNEYSVQISMLGADEDDQILQVSVLQKNES